MLNIGAMTCEGRAMKRKRARLAHPNALLIYSKNRHNKCTPLHLLHSFPSPLLNIYIYMCVCAYIRMTAKTPAATRPAIIPVLIGELCDGLGVGLGEGVGEDVG